MIQIDGILKINHGIRDNTINHVQ